MKGDFEKLVEEAVESIPLVFREKIENVSIVVADYPSVEQLKKVRPGGLLLGLYEGVPKTRGGGYQRKFPDKITIFKFPLLKISKNEQDLKRNINNTVIHEIAHHFGMDEKQVRDAEGHKKK